MAGELTPLGWTHTVACCVALALGAYLLGYKKGDRRHRNLGRWYIAAQLVLNATALSIYRLQTFFFPHVLAIATLIITAAGWAFGHFHRPRRIWNFGHLSCMIVSFYLLIGGGVNEVYLRIACLHDMAIATDGTIVERTHQVLQLLFLVMLIGWNIFELVRARLARVETPHASFATKEQPWR